MYQSGKMKCSMLVIIKQKRRNINKLDFILKQKLRAARISRTFPNGDTICCNAVIFSPSFALGT